MAKPLGKTFIEIDLDDKKYEKGIVDVKTTTKKKLSEIEKAWKGMGKKSEATYDQMRANVNKSYDKIKKHSLSTADDIVRAEKAKSAKIAKINKQQFGEQKSWIDKAKKHWMALSAVAVAAFYAIGRAIQKSLSMYADWEVALQRLGNVSDETIPEMREKILSISPALGTVTELTEGYYQVLSAGVTEPLEAMDLLTASAKMSKEATIEQAESVKGLAALMGTYSTELTTANDAADLLYTTEALGITKVGELIPLIGSLAAGAKAVGLKADEMAAALAQVTTTGAGTAISVTQLQSLLTALSKKFALLPPEVTKYGSATAAVKALGFQGVLKEIMEATGGNSTALIKMLGRQEAYLALLQLSKNEFGDYSGKLEDMTNKAGAFDDAWKRYSITLTAIWDTFKNTIGKQAILIGEKLAPAIKKITEKASEWLDKNEEFITQQVSTYYDAAATSLNAIADALNAIGNAWQASMGYFLGAGTAIGKHQENIAKAEKMIISLKEQIQYADVAFLGAGESSQEMANYVAELNKQIKEQQAIIDTNTKSLKSYNKEGAKKEPETQTKKNTDAIKETTEAVNKLEEAIVDEGAAAIAAANLKEINAIEETRRIEEVFKAQAKATIEGLDLLEKAEKDKIKLSEKTRKEQEKDIESTRRADEASAMARLHAYESMYRDLSGYENDYYAAQELLIEKQREEYIKLTDDIIAADAWAVQEHERLERDKILASDSFFAGMKVGLDDMAIAQDSWAEHGKNLFDDMRTAWQTAVGDMVDDFIAGEEDKRSVAEITGGILTDIAGRTSKRMFDAAIDALIDLISVQIGAGAAGAGAAGSMKGGVVGALAEIGTFLAVGVGAMLAGRAMGEKFRASGGWIGAHPGGGMIQQGTGIKDDVLLGYTPGARHWGMGGEYVINKESTAKYGALLEAINRDRGMMTGGYIDRAYQRGGPALPWEPMADVLAIGSLMSGIHGFTKGGIFGALAEMITFFVSAVTMMFGGKALADQFKAGGGMIDVGHFDLGPISDITGAISDIAGAITAPLEGVPIIGDIIGEIEKWTDPEYALEKVMKLIRTPLEAISKDLVTPGKYYSNPIDTVTNILENINPLTFRQGGEIPRDGLFYGHKGEQVIKKENTRGGITINSPLIHIGGNLIADKQVFDDFVEDIEYALDKRSKKVYA